MRTKWAVMGVIEISASVNLRAFAGCKRCDTDTDTDTYTDTDTRGQFISNGGLFHLHLCAWSRQGIPWFFPVFLVAQ